MEPLEREHWSVLRQVTPEGILHTVVGSGVWEYPPGRSNDKNNARTVQLFFPQGVSVDRQGNLVGRLVGARDWESPAARKLVEELLEMK